MRLVHRWLSVIGAAVVVSCASTEVTDQSGPITLTGTYVGTQDGTHAGIQFQEDVLQMTILQTDDSLTGQWEALIGGLGTLSAEIIPSDSILEFTFELVQTAPCDGTYEGVGEARVGVRGTGQRTVGLSGSYSGSDCEGTLDADFIVIKN